MRNLRFPGNIRRGYRYLLSVVAASLAALVMHNSGVAYGMEASTRQPPSPREIGSWSEFLGRDNPDDLTGYLRATTAFNPPFSAADYLETPLVDQEWYFIGLVDGFIYFLRQHGIDWGLSQCLGDDPVYAPRPQLRLRGPFHFFLAHPEIYTGQYTVTDWPKTHATDLFAEMLPVECLAYDRLFPRPGTGVPGSDSPHRDPSGPKP